MPKHFLQVTILRHLAVLLLCAALGVGQAGAGSMTLLGAGKAGSAAADPFALDGTPQTNSATTASLVLPAFSTTFSNDVIYIGLITNDVPTGCTGGSLTFTQRKSSASGGTVAALYSAPASGPLSSAVFTCTTGVSAFFTAVVFGFSGSHSVAPFDSNAAIPSSSTGAAALTFTTSNANDILVAVGSRNAAIDAPFTGIIGANFLSVGYNIVTSTQSASTVTFGGSNVVSVGDAIIKGP